MKAIITIGVSASGKTTFAKQHAITSKRPTIIISRDDYRRAIQTNRGHESIFPGVNWSKWNFRDEKLVNAMIEIDLDRAAQNKYDVIMCDTNLNFDRLTNLTDELKRLGYEVEVKYFLIDFAEACKRDASRPNGVGHSVIATQMEQLVELQIKTGFIKPYVLSGKLPNAYIFDIDGTIAEKGDRNIYDWDMVGIDIPIMSVVNVLRSLFDSGYRIILTSGRDGSCRKQTEDWLFRKNIPFNELFMREPEDRRKDSVVKLEIFEKEIRNAYDVVGVFDDRPQVTRMWRELGLNVFQLGNPYREF